MLAAEKKPSLPLQSPEKLWSRDYILVIGVSLLLFVSFHIFTPILPYYLPEIGGKSSTAGLMVGIASLCALFMRPLTGWLLDTKGRKGIFVAGVVILCIAALGYNLFGSITALFLLRALHGLSWGCSNTSASTAASDFVPRKRFAEGMAIFGLTANISMAIAPPLGLYIALNHGFDMLFAFTLFFALTALILVLNIRFYKLPKEGAKKTPHGIFHAPALPPAVVMLFGMMPYGCITTFAAIYTTEMGAANGAVYFTITAVVIGTLRIFAGRICDAKGDVLPMVIGLAGMTAAPLLLFFAEGLLPCYISAVCLGVGMGLMSPVAQAMSVRSAPPERRGAANSTFLCSFDLGIGGGAALAGLLLHFLGDYPRMFLVMALPMIASVLLFFFWAKKGDASSVRQNG
ncbi:MAG: MFS transporter [Clostridiales bacterium]|nr:MFS transporter [Clostridiales bacterium]